MTPGKIQKAVVQAKIQWIRDRQREIALLPLKDIQDFLSDPRNPLAAESCLRRLLEALLDLGRHILAKGFGEGVLTYKEIARRLGEYGVLSPETAELFIKMAGYRNRMVHFYEELSSQELYALCTKRLPDVEKVVDEFLKWLKNHPERLDAW